VKIFLGSVARPIRANKRVLAHRLCTLRLKYLSPVW